MAAARVDTAAAWLIIAAVFVAWAPNWAAAATETSWAEGGAAATVGAVVAAAVLNCAAV